MERKIRTEKILEPLKKLLADKKSYYTPAEAAKSIGKIGSSQAVQLLKQNIDVESWNDAIRSGVLAGIAQLQTEEAITLLKKYAGYGTHHRSRMVAIRGLSIIGKGRDDVLDLILKLSDEDFPLVQLSCAVALGDLGDERAIPMLKKLTTGHRDGRVKRLI